MDYINVYIEALTGTRFHLRVSLQDRIFAIKMWILRHEGIPASYQHLIYGDVELEDDATLESCHVPDKATLKLVVSMRGGPVRMRRIPPSGEVDMSWLEMWDLLDLNQEQIWDVAPGGKPVTVLLFRDGESVNFFRVIENSDGTYSPLSETLNGNTLRSLFAEADDESARKAIENDLLREKLNELRTKMQLKEKEKRERKRRRRSVVVKPGSAGRSGSSRTGSSSHLRTPRGTPEKLQTVHGSRSSKASIRTSTGTGLKLPPINATTTTTTTTGTRNKYRVMPKVDTGLRGSSNNKTQKKVIGLETETLLMAAAAASSAVRKTSVVKQETVQQVTETGARVFGSDAQRPRTTPNLDFGKAFEREIVTISPALSTVSELGTKLHNEAKGTEIMNILNSKRSKFNRAMEAQRKGALLRDEVKPKPQKILEIDLDTPDDRVLEALRRLSIGEERVKSPEGKVRRPRCSVCRKKLNLTNGFDCRCGNLFCGLHRYAEAHDCSFDYKTEGRRQISESNPLVIAQKLPKI